MLESSPLIGTDEDTRRANTIVRAMAIITVVVCIVTFISTVIFGAVIIARSPRLSQDELNRILKNKPLPASYIVPDDVRTPAKNQARRGTCYIFSTLGVLEASYRRNGLKKGLLKKDQYVKFSEQAYGLGLVKRCKDNPSAKFCNAGGPGQGSTEDGQPEWLYYMQDDMMPYVLPDSLCPYKPDPEDEYKCDGLEDAVKNNPISFKVKKMETAYSIDAMKRLMYEKEFPLTFSHVVLDSTAIVPCDDVNRPSYTSEQCTECRHPCPQSTNGCCAHIVNPGYTGNGVFSTFGESVVGGGHSMLLVGWNDDMAVETGVSGGRVERVVGGFIIKNSWDTTVGHSAEYWAQRHSPLDETAICPNEKNREMWVPVNTTCMKENKDVNACAFDLKTHVGKDWIKGPTVLKCNDYLNRKPGSAASLGWPSTECDVNKRYLIEGDPDTDFSTPYLTIDKNVEGAAIYHLFEFDPEHPEDFNENFTTKITTPYALERLLQPAEVKGNSNHCGYYFMPYDTFLKSNIIHPTYGTDTPTYSYLDIEWDDKSYVDDSSDSKYDLMKKSTFTYVPPKFDGPLDYDNTN